MARPARKLSQGGQSVLPGEFRRLHLAHRGRCGAPRIHALLRGLGQEASRGRIERLMRHHGIKAIMCKRPCLAGEEAWVIGEWRSSCERKYYFSNLPANANLKTLAATIKARWVCEQVRQQMKEEPGLDHFEGRSWQGLHRNAFMTMIA
ncbi:MAG: IS3 family transposase [Methylocapsa sp.]|nr:IS3 family transposase [Methylocapsa sp.]